MIKDLHIENIAIIESADISFNSGLNVLTGETGAGKSIIIDSLNAVIGNRTSKDIVRNGANYALVTAEFLISRELNWFSDNDIEQTQDIIIQRKISNEGKSSCRVNGIPVTATQLKELASLLIDIHGQNDGQKLLDEKYHLNYLDSFGSLSEYINNYYSEYTKLVSLFNQIKTINSENEDKDRLIELLNSKIDELSNAKIKNGEYDDLSVKLELLRNSEKIKDSLDNSVYLLSNSDKSIISMLDDVDAYLEKATKILPQFENYLNSLRETKIIIKDIYESLNDYRIGLDFSEEDYNIAETRKSQLDRLMRKYSSDENGLLNILNESQIQLDNLQYSDIKLEKLKNEYSNQKALCYEAAKTLSDKRKAVAEELEEKVIKELSELNMPSIKFKVHFDDEPKLTKHGIDNVCFLMSANIGEELGRINRIASGGELSRIMLALKNVFSQNDLVDTMIFDEIDTGVSGISAQRVAEKLYSVSKNKQVMCVTHLPQIAAMADSHYNVQKSESNGRTLTKVFELNDEERKYEISRLYGGENITSSTIAAAGDQIASATEFKRNT